MWHAKFLFSRPGSPQFAGDETLSFANCTTARELDSCGGRSHGKVTGGLVEESSTFLHADLDLAGGSPRVRSFKEERPQHTPHANK